MKKISFDFYKAKIATANMLKFRQLGFIPDSIYLKIAYRLQMGKNLDLVNPICFNEKLQWLKLFDRNPLYTIFADKYEVRNFIAEVIGEEYLIPLIGVWDRFEDIDFSSLPNQFVLKMHT